MSGVGQWDLGAVFSCGLEREEKKRPPDYGKNAAEAPEEAEAPEATPPGLGLGPRRNPAARPPGHSIIRPGPPYKGTDPNLAPPRGRAPGPLSGKPDTVRDTLHKTNDRSAALKPCPLRPRPGALHFRDKTLSGQPYTRPGPRPP